MNAVRFLVSGALLREALHMPAGCRILAANVPVTGRYGQLLHETVEFVVESPDVPDAEDPHDVEPVITRVQGDQTLADEYLWEWRIAADG